MSDTFTVYIEHEVWLRMSALARECSHEISGLAKARRDEDADMVIYDVCCLPQNGSGASTHIDMEEVAKFLAHDIAGRKAQKKAQQTEWLCWFHSHPGGGKPAYSSTDHDTLRDLANSTEGSELPLFLGLVIGGDGQESRAYLGLRWPCKVELEGEVVVFGTKAETAATKWAKEQIKEKVKPAKYTRPTGVVTHGLTPWDWSRREAQSPLPLETTMTKHGVWDGDHQHYRWFEGDRYQWDPKTQIYSPAPMEHAMDRINQLAHNPFRSLDGRIVLYRSKLIPTGTHPKLSRAEKAIRKSLDEKKITPGEGFKIDEDMLSLCTKCGDDALGANDICFCLGCERDELHCHCRVIATGDYEGRLAQVLG